MKIEYDLKKNLYKCQDLFCGVFINQKEIKKNPHKKIKSYSSIILHYAFVVLLMLLTLIFIWMFVYNEKIIALPIILTTIILLLFLFSYVLFLINYLSEKKKRWKGILEFTKEGIID